MKIYMDESGFTGADYCNKEQPLFVLSCTWFDDDFAKSVEANLLADSGMSELKFSKLSGSGKGQRKLVELIGKIADKKQDEKYAVYVVHKKSALVRKFVLDCIEPAAYEHGGIDMLEDGLSVTYANLFSTVMPVFMGKEWYDDFLILYNKLIRSKDEPDNKALWEHCMKATKHKDAHEILIPYLGFPHLVMDELHGEHYKTDMYDSIVMGLITHLRHMFGVKEFELIMDSTKSTTSAHLHGFLKNLERLTSEHKMSDVCTIYPDIKINGVAMVDSKNEIGVRMSDIMSGLYSWSFKSSENLESLVAKALSMKIVDRNLIHMINTTDVDPNALGMRGAKNPWKGMKK